MTFTKEQLIARAETVLSNARTAADFHDSKPYHLMDFQLAEITLASLTAEPVAFVMADDLNNRSIISTPAYRQLDEARERTVGDVVALYTAPPAPVSVPDEIHARSSTEDHKINKAPFGAFLLCVSDTLNQDGRLELVTCSLPFHA